MFTIASLLDGGKPGSSSRLRLPASLASLKNVFTGWVRSERNWACRLVGGGQSPFQRVRRRLFRERKLSSGREEVELDDRQARVLFRCGEYVSCGSGYVFVCCCQRSKVTSASFRICKPQSEESSSVSVSNPGCTRELLSTLSVSKRKGGTSQVEAWCVLRGMFASMCDLESIRWALVVRLCSLGMSLMITSCGRESWELAM